MPTRSIWPPLVPEVLARLQRVHGVSKRTIQMRPLHIQVSMTSTAFGLDISKCDPLRKSMGTDVRKPHSIRAPDKRPQPEKISSTAGRFREGRLAVGATSVCEREEDSKGCSPGGGTGVGGGGAGFSFTAQEMREDAAGLHVAASCAASLDALGSFARKRPRSTAPGFKTPRSAKRLSASDGLRSVSQYLRSQRTPQPNRIAAERRQIAFSP